MRDYFADALAHAAAPSAPDPYDAALKRAAAPESASEWENVSPVIQRRRKASGKGYDYRPNPGAIPGGKPAVGKAPLESVGSRLSALGDRAVTAAAEGLVALPEIVPKVAGLVGPAEVTLPAALGGGTYENPWRALDRKGIYPTIGAPGGPLDLHAQREDIRRQHDAARERLLASEGDPAVLAAVDSATDVAGQSLPFLGGAKAASAAVERAGLESGLETAGRRTLKRAIGEAAAPPIAREAASGRADELAQEAAYLARRKKALPGVPGADDRFVQPGSIAEAFRPEGEILGVGRRVSRETQDAALGLRAPRAETEGLARTSLEIAPEIPPAPAPALADRIGERGSISTSPLASARDWVVRNFKSGGPQAGQYELAAREFEPGRGGLARALGRGEASPAAVVRSVPKRIEALEGRRAVATQRAQDILDEATPIVREVAPSKKGQQALWRDLQAASAGDLPIEQIPEPLRPLVARRQQLTEALQKRGIDTGAFPDDMVEAISKSGGKYHHRTYRAFKDPQHYEKVADTPDWYAARDYLKKELPAATDGEVQDILLGLTKREKGATALTIQQAPTRLNSILRERKNIPPPLRKLMGEETDFRLTTLETVEQLARDIETHNFWKELGEDGLAAGVFREAGSPPAGSLYTEGGLFRRISGSNKVEGISSRGPVEGLLTREALRDVLVGQFEPRKVGLGNRIAAYVNLGKSQPLDSVVYTPTGPARMGDLRVGDLVLAVDGTTSPVTAIYPQGQRSVYRLKFSDGAEAEADLEHLWEVSDWWGGKGIRTRLATTEELLRLKKRALRSTWVPQISPVALRPRLVPLDPYLVGLLLGDGGLTTEVVRFSSRDPELVEALRLVLPAGHSLVKEPTGADWRITAGKGAPQLRKAGAHIRGILASLGMLVGSHEKRIPDIYRYNSTEVRRAVLQGILDTDGYVDDSGQPRLEQTSETLARDVEEVVRSLGGTVLTRYKAVSGYRTQAGDFVSGRPVFRQGIRFPDSSWCFRLTRKAQLTRPKRKSGSRMFREISFSRIAECQCIQIAHERHLYLTNDLVPTHNTVGSFPAGHIRNFAAHHVTSFVNGKSPVLVYQKAPELRRLFTDPAMRSLRDRAIELGVIGDGASSREVFDFIQTIEEGTANPLAIATVKAGKALGKSWRAGDHVWRTAHWLDEVEQLAWANPEMSRPAVEALAADRVLDTFQTYSRAPEAAARLRRTPLGGPGVTFHMESVRNVKNIANIAASDIVTGYKQRNLRMVALGMRRVAGLMTGPAIVASIPAVSRLMSGSDRRQQEAMRRQVLPYYLENAEVFTYDFKPGKSVSIVDLSFLNPYSSLSRSAIAAYRSMGEANGVPAAAAIGEFLDQVSGGDIATKELLQLVTNESMGSPWELGDRKGSPIYNLDEAPQGWAAAKDAGYHAYRGFAPGGVVQSENLLRGAGVLNNEGQAGRVRNLPEEVAATLGARPSTYDIPKSFRFNLAKKGDRFEEVTREFCKVVPADPAKLARQADLYLDSWSALYEETRQTVEDYQLLGMDAPAIRSGGASVRLPGGVLKSALAGSGAPPSPIRLNARGELPESWSSPERRPLALAILRRWRARW